MIQRLRAAAAVVSLLFLASPSLRAEADPVACQVGAYYFPQWHVDAANQKTHGKPWTEWETVQAAKPKFAGQAQPKVPVWGCEDEADPKVMEKKIQAAAEHGVGFFLFDWYWDMQAGQGPYLQRCLDEGYLKAANNADVKFCLMWANHQPVDRARFDAAVERMLGYFKHPSYFRVQGRPFLSIYEIDTLAKGLGGIEALRQALESLRQRAREAGCGEVHLDIIDWQVKNHPDEAAFLKDLKADSVTSYVWVHQVPLKFPQADYEEVRAEYGKFVTEKAARFGVSFYPNVTVGWDSTPRMVADDKWDNSGYPDTAVIANPTPDRFRAALVEAKQRAERLPVGQRIVTINSWNEWTEGSYLEPDTVRRMGYLEAVREVFGKPELSSKNGFRKITLTRDFVAEGAHAADFDHDGAVDVCAGPYVWFGPDFKTRLAYATPPPQPPDPATGYSDYFLTYTCDIDRDKWADIVVFSWPGKETWWFKNPGKRQEAWERHVLIEVTDSESPMLGDIDGDQRSDIICVHGGQPGYATLGAGPDFTATFHPCGPKDDKKFFRYTHGIGFGDLNGDGRMDLLEKEGWREQPAPGTTGDWPFHPVTFAPGDNHGGAQMLVFDVDGDGKNDVVTATNCHIYGLAWFRNKGDGTFDTNWIFPAQAAAPGTLGFSQIHALDPVDMNGDGVMDFVAGKRRWAHGSKGDIEPDAPPVLYWFECVRSPQGARFIPHLIDDDSGVGTEVTVAEIDGKPGPDIVVANKSGVFVFLNERKGK